VNDSMPNSTYVVAFSGARDAYQVPLALHQTGQLNALITDFYAPELPSLLKRRFPKLAGRNQNGLPFWKARSSFQVAWTSRSWSFARKNRATVGDLKRSQDLLSRAAGRIAARTGSDLFLYAGYARVAFEHPALTSARKIVFMYHPHIQRCAEILASDAERWPGAAESIAELERDKQDRGVDEELRAADLVICASEFTASTVRAIGVDSAKLRIVPYGIDCTWSVPVKPRDRCRFLFVGSGIHRKGLHTLLHAWKAARLTACELTLVCRHITPWIRELADLDGVTIRSNVAPSTLRELYGRSDIFVMPSLVEGFGYVYLEALAHGCFCIGSRNSGLPDLDVPSTAGEVVEPGNVEVLTQAMIAAHRNWKAEQYQPAQIQQIASRWSWDKFRRAIVAEANNGRNT
jgi:glycosyltransferase involved in cell wall biosynthesis